MTNAAIMAGRAGRMIDIDGVAAIRFDRQLAGPPAEVWRALTEPARLKQWMQADATVEPHAGGRFVLRFVDHDHTMAGVITRWEPPAVLEFTWPEPHANGRSLVRFELRETGSGTALILTHLLQAGGEQKDFAAGWHWHLDALDHALEEQAVQFDKFRFSALRQHYTATM